MNNQRSEVKSENFTQLVCKTRQQMSSEFGWRSVQTFRTKLRQNGIKLPSGSITPKWQKIIYDKLGYPHGVSKKDFEDV